MTTEPISKLKFRFQVAMLRTGVGTLDRLALRTGIERSRLSRISNGYIVPRDDERAALAAVLGEPDLFEHKG
jgi:hypothetical protein